jgi:hypothetical protein
MLSSMSGQFLETFPEAQMSLQRYGQEEAQRFKWIQSEKEGRDLGDHAIKLWVLQHWNGFLRQRWIEHLQGKTCWIELQKEDFGLLQRRFRTSPLINPILDRLKVLKENLDIILWAQDVFPRSEMQEVLDILEELDVNSCRIRCEFDPRKELAGGSKPLAELLRESGLPEASPRS